VADRPVPLLQRYPALARIPRVDLGVTETPVESVVVTGVPLLLKRDDRSATPIGGNKVRGLEWLLGPLAGDSRRPVLTVGPRGSTHALATAGFARALGAATTVVRWNQEMNEAADVVDRLTRDLRYAHTVFSRRLALHDVRETTLFEEQIAILLDTKPDSSFARHLAIAAYDYSLSQATSSERQAEAS